MTLLLPLSALLFAGPPDGGVEASSALVCVRSRVVTCEPTAHLAHGAGPCEVEFTLAADGGRGVDEADLLVGQGSGLMQALTGGSPWAPVVFWRNGDRAAPIEARLIDPFPGRATDVLVAKASDGRTVSWVHLDAATPVVRFLDEGPGSMELLGARIQTLEVTDLEVLMDPDARSEGPAGCARGAPSLTGGDLETLLRSAGLAADGRPPVKDADRALLGLCQRGLSAEASPTAALLGALAFWLLPVADPVGFRDWVVAASQPGEASGFGARLAANLDALRGLDPHVWAIASSTLLTEDPRDRSDERFIAEALTRLPASEMPAFLAALPLCEPARQAVDLAAGPVLSTVQELGDAEALALVDALGRQSGALLHVFDPELRPVLKRLLGLLGEDRLLGLSVPLLGRSLPSVLVQALGDPAPEVRRLAVTLLSAGGAPVVKALSRRLVELGHRLPNEMGLTAQQVVAALSGVLLAPLARPFHDQAWRRHLAGLDCLPPFEEARRSIHPNLVLPEPLNAQCRALRAVLMAREGATEGALGLLEHLPRGDALVATRHAEVLAAVASRRLEAGDLEGAQALLDLAPDPDALELVGVRVDLLTEQGHRALADRNEDLARRYFTAARRIDGSRPTAEALIDAGRAALHDLLFVLLVVMLCGAVAAGGLRLFQRAMILHDFRLGTGKQPGMVFDGPGGRRLLLAPFGLLSMRPLSYRMVSFSELDSAWLVSGERDRSGVLFRLADGSSFVVPTASLRRFDLFVAQLEGYLDDVGRPLETLAPLDEDVARENAAATDRLRRRDALNRGLRIAGAMLAVTVVYLATVTELAGGVWSSRLVIGLGIGGGLLVITTAAVHAILPVSRA